MNRGGRTPDGEPKLHECVVLSGGRSNDALHAIAGRHRWDIERKERVADFIERAKQAARRHGERSIIIRGLKWV